MEYGPAQIKFKALNLSNISHVPDVIYFTLDDLLLVLSGSGTVNPYPSKKSMQDLMRFREYNTNPNAIRLFTGHQDSQGEDIYGGDIVKIQGKDKTDMIHWDNNGWQVGNWVPGEVASMKDQLTVIGVAK